MPRPKIMDDMKVVSHALDKSDVEIIERERGDMTASAYLRYIIRETQSTGGNAKLQKELRDTKAKLEVFERKEKAIVKENVGAMREIADSFTGYLAKYPNSAQSQQDNWLSSRCKDSCGVKPHEILSYISPEIPAIVEADKI